MASIKSSLSLLVFEVNMFKWLKRVFHCHDWKIINTRPLVYTDSDGNNDKGTRYVIQCKVCGDVSHRDVI